MTSPSPPGPSVPPPIRRESTIKSLGKKARALNIGLSHAAEEAPKEQGVRQEWCSAYRLNWAEKVRPFLQGKFPELKAKYETKHLANDRYWFVVPEDLTGEDTEKVKADIEKLRDKDPQHERRADSPGG